MLKHQVQTALKVLFPPSCAGCRALVESDHGLCGTCWRQVPFITGPICQGCGTPVLAEADDPTALCEDCAKTDYPWQTGRAAIRYRDLGRKLVMSLKHGDRQDIALTVAPWLARAAQEQLQPDTVIAPVPLHWSRLLKRRFNQSALLAQHLALSVDRRAVPDLLQRTQRTVPLDGATVEQRFARLEGCMSVSPSRKSLIEGKPVLIVDDVMTSGATFTTAAKSCLEAGASRVDVLALARVAKDT